MRKYFISKEKKQFKANLHCHSTDSDGRLSPERLKDAYRAEGYSVLAITDHEYPRDRSYMNEDDFLMLTGYEAHIHGNVPAVPGLPRPTVHLNLFAKEPSNETVICYYEKDYRRYYKPETRDRLDMAGDNGPREYSVEYINNFTRLATENGYLVSYNHPVWSAEQEERILAYENIFSLEIENYSADIGGNLQHSGALYDKMLRLGRHVYCHGGDDNHNVRSEPWLSDSFGAYTMILADSLRYSHIIGAMEKGDMYASTGPRIYELSYENGTVHIECSPASKICVFNGSRKVYRSIAPTGETITSADIEVPGTAPYFRVSVLDNNWHRATTRGYFREELEG